MIIGVPKEIKNNEKRVGLTPDNVKRFIAEGHQVLVEKNAGLGANFLDSEYLDAGAVVIQTANEIYSKSDMIIKVKEPEPFEYNLLKEKSILFTYLHLAANKPLMDVLLSKKITSIAYETIEDEQGNLPCLRPMSEIAGRLAIQEGAKYIESVYGGRGILLGGVPGVKKGKVTIIGGGVVGTYAAKAAVGMGANVTILDKNMNRLIYLADIFGNSVTTLYSDETNLVNCLENADLVIGCVLNPGGTAPKVIKEDYVKRMKKGSVIVDIAIDQGGCAETSHVTTHENPIFIKHGVVHYCVGNMPGSVPYTSTVALTNITTSYGIKIANNCHNLGALEIGILKGINTYKGCCANTNLGKSLDLPALSLNDLINML